MVAIVSPMWTVVPSVTLRLSTPPAGAGMSTFAFSVSSSARGSSALTRSPSRLCHLIKVASLTDSPSAGTATLVGIGGGFYDGCEAFQSYQEQSWLLRATILVAGNCPLG